MESLDRSNRFFKRPRKRPSPLGPFLGSISPLTPNVINICKNLLYKKLYLYRNYNLWFENFDDFIISLSLSTLLMLKIAPKGTGPLYELTQKSNKYWCFFHSKVVLFGPTSYGWIKIRFFLTLSLGTIANNKKLALEAMVAFGAFGFCSRHQRVKNNENQKCSNWPVIKWETFIRNKKKITKYSLLVK